MDKFDFYRYVARSFLLPLFGALAIFGLAYAHPEKWAISFELKEYGKFALDGMVLPAIGIILCVFGFLLKDYMADKAANDGSDNDE